MFCFFLLYSLCLIASIAFSLPFFQTVFLCLLIIFLWKIILGLSWFNFIFLFLGFLEANILIFCVKPFWVIIFVLVFLGLFWKKLFFPLPKENYWRDVLFYYIFLIWIIISYGFYFFFNYPFLVGFLAYALGLIIFSYFYFLSSNISFPDFLPSFFVLILINLEFFLLLSYLSLSTLVLSILAILFFRLLIYFYEKEFLPTFPL